MKKNGYFEEKSNNRKLKKSQRITKLYSYEECTFYYRPIYYRYCRHCVSQIHLYRFLKYCTFFYKLTLETVLFNYFKFPHKWQDTWLLAWNIKISHSMILRKNKFITSKIMLLYATHIMRCPYRVGRPYIWPKVENNRNSCTPA